MEATFKITKFVYDRAESYQLDSKDSWPSEILDELEERIPHGVEKQNSNSKIEIDLTLLRKKSFTLKDHLIIEGDITVTFLSECIRCLVPFSETISLTFVCCFIDKSLAKLPEYEDVSEIFCTNSCMELYFYDKKEINLKDVIHEQIFLNKNHRPLHDNDCKGLCSTCGFNLNLGKCIHHRSKEIGK